jgi:hypothetical protein
MRVASGKVVHGQIVYEGELPEGASVTLIADDDEVGFHVDPQLKTVLLEAVAGCDRGEKISADQLGSCRATSDASLSDRRRPCRASASQEAEDLVAKKPHRYANGRTPRTRPGGEDAAGPAGAPRLAICSRGRIAAMRVSSGKVVSGHIVLEGEPFPDGAIVTVLARDVDESFELDAAAEAELLLSLAEADRGELIPAEDVFQTFRDAE